MKISKQLPIFEIFWLIAEGQLFELRESEVVKTSGSSDDNKKEFLKQLLMFWKIQAYFKELMFEHRLARGCERSV